MQEKNTETLRPMTLWLKNTNSHKKETNVKTLKPSQQSKTQPGKHKKHVKHIQNKQKL